MLFKFNTDDLTRARAALLIYTIYRSRNKNSSVNGTETWQRLNRFIEWAILRSGNTAEFATALCAKCESPSFKPKYHTVDNLVHLSDGSIMETEKIYDYETINNILADDNVYKVIKKEAVYIISLVRGRINDEKTLLTEDDEDDN